MRTGFGTLLWIALVLILKLHERACIGLLAPITPLHASSRPAKQRITQIPTETGMRNKHMICVIMYEEDLARNPGLPGTSISSYTAIHVRTWHAHTWHASKSTALQRREPQSSEMEAGLHVAP